MGNGGSTVWLGEAKLSTTTHFLGGGVVTGGIQSGKNEEEKGKFGIKLTKEMHRTVYSRENDFRCRMFKRFSNKYILLFCLLNIRQIARYAVKVGGFSSALEQRQAEKEEEGEEENNKTFCCSLLPFPQFEIFAGDRRGDGSILSSGQEKYGILRKKKSSCLFCGKTKLLTRKHFSGIEIECFASSMISRPIVGN